MSRSLRGASSFGVLLAGLWQRRWLSFVVFVVATIAAAAAAMGPPYAEAARTAVLRAAFAEAGPDAQGIMVSYPPIARPRRNYDNVREATGAAHLLASSVPGAELVSSVVDAPPDDVKLIWRQGACAHLVMVQGRCPAETGEVVASLVTSERYGWSVGGRVLLDALIPGGPGSEFAPREVSDRFPLTVVGIYEPRNPDENYWLGLPYFPDTTGVSDAILAGRMFDPLFTVRPTVESTRPASVPWETNVSLFLDPQRLAGDDALLLDRAVTRTREWAADGAQRRRAGWTANVYSGMESTASRALREQAALGVPIALVIMQLIGVSWLVLFLAITDLIQARRSEIGLARLRGLPRRQVWRFAIAEPAVLLVVALPVGVLVGWLTAATVAGVVLLDDVAVPLDGLAWLAAAGAVGGGLLGAIIAARSSVTAPVTEQLRRSRSYAEKRSWIPDVIVLALVGVGLIELTSGDLSDASQSRATGLLTPGLMALGSALVVSRALPRVSRALFGASRRAGLAPFIALRQIARAPGVANAIVVLAASFGLATFAVSAWSVTTQNHLAVARTHNGAHTVLIVRTPEGSSLRGLVNRVDPGGRSAAAVAVYEAGTRYLAVDTDRVGRVAHWESDFAEDPLEVLLDRIRPPVAPRVLLTGDSIRVALDTTRMPTSNFTVRANLELPGRIGPVSLLLRRSGGKVFELHQARLSQACGRSCELRGLTVTSGVEDIGGAERAELLVTKVEVRSSGRWHAIDVGLTTRTRWRTETPAGELPADSVATDDGLQVTFLMGVETDVVVDTHPEALPAITVGPVAPDPGGSQANGLDGVEQPVARIARAQGLPGAIGQTAMVDYALAENAAFGLSPKVQHQVWVTRGAAPQIVESLRNEGVTVSSERTVEELVRDFEREGPGLALMLLLAAAGAAAVLAIVRAVFGLYATRRRRTYEFAALTVIGVPARTQKRALLIEQAITLGVGVLAGVGAGIIAGGVALKRVPQFARQPSTPPLHYSPDPMVLGAIVVGTTIAVALVTIISTRAVFSSVSMEQLREVPP